MRGALDIFDARDDVEVVPTYSALSMTSAGPLRQDSFDEIAAGYRAAVTAAMPVDAVYLALHGAMQATDELDPEGKLLMITREIVGENVPIVISMDLHGIPTNKMISCVNGLVAYHTYPHNDFVDTGQRAARLLLKIIDGQVDLRFELPGRPSSEENTISSMTPAKTIGWSSFVPPYKYKLSAYCAGETCRILQIEKDYLLGLFEKDSQMGYTVISNLTGVASTRFHRLQDAAA